MRRLVPGLGAVALLAGCFARAGGDGDSPDAAGPLPIPDAAADAAPIVVDNACGVATDQGDVGTLAADARVRNQGSTSRKIYRLGAPTPRTENDPRPDVIFIELWENFGAFAGTTAHPGTFPIAGPELDYQTCGVCVFTLADVDDDNGATRILFATAGQVTVNAVGPAAGTAVSVEVESVVFQEVDQEFQPVGSNCPSPLQHGQLDGVI